MIAVHRFGSGQPARTHRFGPLNRAASACFLALVAFSTAVGAAPQPVSDDPAGPAQQPGTRVEGERVEAFSPADESGRAIHRFHLDPVEGHAVL